MVSSGFSSVWAALAGRGVGGVRRKPVTYSHNDIYDRWAGLSAFAAAKFGLQVGDSNGRTAKGGRQVASSFPECQYDSGRGCFARSVLRRMRIAGLSLGNCDFVYFGQVFKHIDEWGRIPQEEFDYYTSTC